MWSLAGYFKPESLHYYIPVYTHLNVGRTRSAVDLLFGVQSTTFSPCLRGVDCCTEGDPVNTSEVLSAKAEEVELDLGFAAIV